MKRILIVDDEAMARRMLSRTLSREGYVVSEARDGQEAWELLGRETPDAIITDIDMPRMNGEQLCKKIDTEVPGRSFPVFVVTSKTAVEHREWSRNIDHLYFLEKPLSLRKLVGRLNTALHADTAAKEARQ